MELLRVASLNSQLNLTPTLALGLQLVRGDRVSEGLTHSSWSEVPMARVVMPEREAAGATSDRAGSEVRARL